MKEKTTQPKSGYLMLAVEFILLALIVALIALIAADTLSKSIAALFIAVFFLRKTSSPQDA